MFACEFNLGCTLITFIPRIFFILYSIKSQRTYLFRILDHTSNLSGMDTYQLNDYIKGLKNEPLSLVHDTGGSDFRFKQVSKDQGTWVDSTGMVARACKMIACMDRSFVSCYGDLPVNTQDEVRMPSVHGIVIDTFCSCRYLYRG